jgi:hypothetical protein
MSELNLAPEPTRISMNIIVIAFVALAAVAAAIYWISPHKPAEVTVVQEQFFAPHTESGQLAGAGGMKVLGAASTEDDLYVVVDLKIDNKLGMPLFFTSSAGTLTSASGEEVDATIVTPHDIPRLEEVFPALTPMIKQPLALDAEVAPKGSASGSVLLLFPNMTEADWKAKKAASVSLNLAHQESLNIPLP